MIQKFIDVLKDDLPITLDYIINQMLTMTPIFFWYTKCLLVSLFTLVKDESKTLILAFWHWIWLLKII